MGSSKQRPLMLKDYLREDQSVDSTGGFPSAYHCGTTVRTLLDVELRQGAGQGKPTELTRSYSKGTPLTRISALLNAVRMLATASSAPKKGILQKSLSKNLLRRSFWRRRSSQREIRSNADDGSVCRKFLIRDVIRIESFVDVSRGGKPVFSPPLPSSPVGSCSCSTSGWSEIDSSSGSDSPDTPSSPVPEFAPGEKKRSDMVATSPARVVGVTPKASRFVDTKVEAEIEQRDAGDFATSHDYDEKQQLSPVAVMDFPYEEEEETASPSFQQSLASIERSKLELLKKIRRFESLARSVDPVDLDEAFSEEDPADEEAMDEAEEEERVRARALLDQVKGRCSAGALDEFLLLDFFLEGLRDRTAEETLLPAARDWTDGIVREDVASLEALMREMDLGGRWRFTNEGVAADLAGEVLSSLLEEVLEG